jgi:hypothetical protein
VSPTIKGRKSPIWGVKPVGSENPKESLGQYRFLERKNKNFLLFLLTLRKKNMTKMELAI